MPDHPRDAERAKPAPIKEGSEDRITPEKAAYGIRNRQVASSIRARWNGDGPCWRATCWGIASRNSSGAMCPPWLSGPTR